MSCVVYGVHEFAKSADLLAVFGHDADYVICSCRLLVAHTESTGVSMVVKTVRKGVRPPRWSPSAREVCKETSYRHQKDCVWSIRDAPLAIDTVVSLFEDYDVVWLVRGGGFAWFRGYTPGSPAFSDADHRWADTTPMLYPGPREAGIGWLRCIGSDTMDARSGDGLPLVHIWEAMEWIETVPGAAVDWALQFETSRDSSNWTYKFGQYEFRSWQNVASVVHCDAYAIFVLSHQTLRILRLLVEWGADWDAINPLICRVSMRDVSTLRLVTSAQEGGRAIDFLLTI